MDSHQSYTSLLCRHRQLVWALCWKKSHGDRECCRDLVQDVSLSLWEHYGKLRPGASPFEERAWVAWHTRTVLDHLGRRPQPETVPLRDEWAARLEEPSSDSPLDELLDSLGDDDRRLVQLRLEGYNATEIANTMNIQRDTVYQRLHRIIERLRKDHNERQR